MNFTIRTIVFAAMLLLCSVSMWTTYVSLHDSILPEPVLPIELPNGVIWQCSVVALGLSVAIGMMLLALKFAIIGGEKRLNFLGILGMTVVAFISISFNLDVLYRTADRDFFLRYSNDRMRSVYEAYLADVQGELVEQRTALRRELAKQAGELESEIQGLRKAPAGYGPYARQEDYKLTVMQKTVEVELAAVDSAIAVKEEADEILEASAPVSITEVEELQSRLRAKSKDLAGLTGLPMPDVVRLENPLFAVFAKLFDFRTVGLKEVFFVLIAFFLDLGDIIGYTLVPNKKPRQAAAPSYPVQRPERIPDHPLLEAPTRPQVQRAESGTATEQPGAFSGETIPLHARRRARAFRIRRP